MKQKKKKGGGGGFDDQFKPPSAEEEPARVVMYRPDEPYKMKLEREGKKDQIIERDYGILHTHFNATAKRSCRCTAGLKREDVEDGDWIIVEGTGTCAPCYEIDSGAEYINIRKVHLFNILLLGWYHEVEVEKESKSRKAKNGTITVKEMKKCRGKRCRYCKKGIDRVYGRRMYWELGPMHTEQLVNLEVNVLGRNCACGGKIKPRAFLCSECEEAVRDLESDPLEEKGELKSLREDEHECPHCGHEGMLVEYSQCDSCSKPRPLTLWNSVMEIYMSGTGKQSVLQISDCEPISVKLAAKIKDQMKPFDWNKLWSYKVLDPDEQAARLNITNPFKKGGKDTKGGDDWDDDNE